MYVICTNKNRVDMAMVADSNSFLSPREILSIAQGKK